MTYDSYETTGDLYILEVRCLRPPFRWQFPPLHSELPSSFLPNTHEGSTPSRTAPSGKLSTSYITAQLLTYTPCHSSASLHLCITQTLSCIMAGRAPPHAGSMHSHAQRSFRPSTAENKDTSRAAPYAQSKADTVKATDGLEKLRHARGSTSAGGAQIPPPQESEQQQPQKTTNKNSKHSRRRVL